MRLERMARTRRRRLRPDVLDQAVDGDHAAVVDEEHGEERPLSRRTERDRRAVATDLERAEDAKLRRHLSPGAWHRCPSASAARHLRSLTQMSDSSE